MAMTTTELVEVVLSNICCIIDTLNLSGEAVEKKMAESKVSDIASFAIHVSVITSPNCTG
jgi:hypothetical protein